MITSESQGHSIVQIRDYSTLSIVISKLKIPEKHQLNVKVSEFLIKKLEASCDSSDSVDVYVPLLLQQL